MFRGTFTALVTPFRDGAIDTSAFEKLIEAQIAAGITGIVTVGTTGESPTLSLEEREQLIRLSVTTANKRCQVLAGTGRRRRAARRAILQQAEPGRFVPAFQDHRRGDFAANHALQYSGPVRRGHRTRYSGAPRQAMPEYRFDQGGQRERRAR